MDSICPKISDDHGPDIKLSLYVLGKWRQHPWWTIQIQYKIYSQLEKKLAEQIWMAILQCIDALSLILCSLSDYLSYYFFLHKLTFMLERVLASRSLTQLLQNFSTRWFIKLSISVPGCDRNILPFFSAAVQSLASWFFPQISKNRAFNQFLLCGEISRT